MNTMETVGGLGGAIVMILLGALALTLAVSWLVLPWILMSKLTELKKELVEANKHLAYQRQLQGNSTEYLASVANHTA